MVAPLLAGPPLSCTALLTSSRATANASATRPIFQIVTLILGTSNVDKRGPPSPVLGASLTAQSLQGGIGQMHSSSPQSKDMPRWVQIGIKISSRLGRVAARSRELIAGSVARAF